MKIIVYLTMIQLDGKLERSNSLFLIIWLQSGIRKEKNKNTKTIYFVKLK